MTLRTICLLSYCFVLTSASLFAASPAPVWAPHGMVSSAEPHATEVGVQVLRNGGNAMDAAAAVALALGVTEGYASGIGGGCFILIRMADGRTAAIDGRETAPARSTRLMFVPKDTTRDLELSTTGVLSAGTPGELAALELALRDFGTKPLSEVLEGAIALADTGFILDFRYERAIARTRDKLSQFEGSRQIFFKPDGSLLAFGDRITQNDLAATLRAVQSKGVDAFYRGRIPQMVEDYVAAHGGILSAKDFAGYRAVPRDPVTGSYHGYEVLSMPPPSSGGIHVIQILNLLELVDLKAMGAGSSAEIHTVAEAMQLAFADRAAFLGDPASVHVPVDGLVSKGYADVSRAQIDINRHHHLTGPGDPSVFDSTNTKNSDSRHTTHLCVVDSLGNAVSITATVNTPFGSGVIVPGTGFLLNNEMDDFVTWPGKPNYFGLVGNAANEVQPGKRPLSSMAPTILVKDNKPIMVVGSMGGPRIITSTLLTIINVLDFGMTVQAALDFPRFHQQWVPDELYLEQDCSADVVAALQNRGHKVTLQPYWSGVNAIVADTTRGGWQGASDSRGAGLAKGF